MTRSCKVNVEVDQIQQHALIGELSRSTVELSDFRIKFSTASDKCGTWLHLALVILLLVAVREARKGDVPVSWSAAGTKDCQR